MISSASPRLCAPTMAAIVALALSFAPTLASAATVEGAPWCARSDGGGRADCAYETLAGCKAAISGEGTCFANPRLSFGSSRHRGTAVHCHVVYGGQTGMSASYLADQETVCD